MKKLPRCDAYYRLFGKPGLARCVNRARFLIVLIFDEAYPVRRCAACAARLRRNAPDFGFDIVFDERIDDA